MPAIIKPIDTEVEYMEDMEVEWISLVDKGANRTPFKVIKNEDTENATITTPIVKSVWSSSFINSLNDSSFAVVETGYKEGENKAARHLPFKDKSGKVDLPHLRNALARCNQIKSVLGNDTDAALQAKAARTLKPYANQYLKTKEECVETVIQSIIVPSAQSLDSYKEKNEWVNEFKVIKTENHDVYTKYISLPIEEIDNNSIRLVKLTKGDDAFALVGNPLKQNGDHLVFKGVFDQPIVTEIPDVGGDNDKTKDPNPNEADIKEDETDDDTDPIEQPSAIVDDYAITFGDLFYTEINYLMQVIVGTMQLSEMPNKTKKNIVFNALDAFKSFLAVGLDTSAKQITVAKREINNNGSEVHMSDKGINSVVAKTEVANINVPQEVGKSDDQLLSVVGNLSNMVQRVLTILDPHYNSKDSSVEEFKETSLTSPSASVDKADSGNNGALAAVQVVSQAVENLLKTLDPNYSTRDNSHDEFNEPSLTDPPSATATLKSEGKVMEMLAEISKRVADLSSKVDASKKDDKDASLSDKLKDKKTKDVVVVTDDDDDDDSDKVNKRKEDGSDDVDDECDDDGTTKTNLGNLRQKSELEELRVKLEKLEQVVEKIDGDIPEPSRAKEATSKKEEIQKEDTVFAGIFGDLKKIR